ncbi:ATP phosphoribosyltransferase regulatory subunit [Suttonella sp. R2A3]|uniref:ATP phosphoribosyltransferase regulatory subunit n=1 Tax=Suttonella sp. R2A3 TaxID=2908648 RepID=UPI001F3005B1|nr:ATP phosphoribosyltransferase regulatory subunit [Suttonella sp. R2A3]UJF24896.1 ATP phosphoribosyltransferase regulatory subunit [Suttonella sp. R2A3]
MAKYWLLPEDIIELLPDAAKEVEALRRLTLDHFASWGYQQVLPPLAEYLDSLLAGSGADLEAQTCKITDHHSGRLMGVRADITPQIARIDAHRLPTDGESRYGYCGEVLRNRSESTEPRRNPLIVGAELFGVSEVGGDVEIIALLLDWLRRTGIDDCVLDLGHAGIFSGLVAREALDADDRALLQDIFAGKKRPDLMAWQAQSRLSDRLIEDVQALMGLYDDAQALDTLREHFAGTHPEFDRAIADLEAVQKAISAFFPEQRTSIDLGSVGSYGYHSGLVFSCFASGHYSAIARGGRYDGVGAAYGRSRPATGFSADLLTLAQLSTGHGEQPAFTEVLFPDNAETFAALAQRRAAGESIRFKHNKGA